MVSYEFQGNVFRLTLEGEYSTADIRHAIDAALASPDYPDDAIFLFDASRSTALGSRSAGELRDMAAFIAARSARFNGRLGMVATGELHFGLLRMGEVYSENHGMEARVFTSDEDALTWLASTPRS